VIRPADAKKSASFFITASQQKVERILWFEEQQTTSNDYLPLNSASIS
jgi:hypothetical protein